MGNIGTMRIEMGRRFNYKTEIFLSCAAQLSHRTHPVQYLQRARKLTTSSQTKIYAAPKAHYPSADKTGCRLLISTVKQPSMEQISLNGNPRLASLTTKI